MVSDWDGKKHGLVSQSGSPVHVAYPTTLKVAFTSTPEHFRNTRRLLRVVTGGFFLRKKPLERMASVYTNSER